MEGNEGTLRRYVPGAVWRRGWLDIFDWQALESQDCSVCKAYWINILFLKNRKTVKECQISNSTKLPQLREIRRNANSTKGVDVIHQVTNQATLSAATEWVSAAVVRKRILHVHGLDALGVIFV